MLSKLCSWGKWRITIETNTMYFWCTVIWFPQHSRVTQGFIHPTILTSCNIRQGKGNWDKGQGPEGWQHSCDRGHSWREWTYTWWWLQRWQLHGPWKGYCKVEAKLWLLSQQRKRVLPLFFWFEYSMQKVIVMVGVYCIVGNFQGRKLLWIGDFRWENFSGLLVFAAPKNTTLPNVCGEKTFTNSHKIAKFASFLPRKFPAMWYHLTMLAICMWY